MDITLSFPVKNSGRVMQVRGMFDVPERGEETYAIRVPEEVREIAKGGPTWREGTVGGQTVGMEPTGKVHTRDWNVGLIVGPSGSGKSTVARELWGQQGEWAWPTDGALLDGFPDGLSTKDITGLLTSVGLGSPPSWLRPFRTLSTGEQFRASVARALSDTERDPVVIDEFTSTVDRTVAQVSSHAVQKTVRRTQRRLVAVTCHFDLVEWLQPDWVYRPDTVDFEWRRLQRHPPLQLEVTPLPHSAWPPFAHHHYLSHVLHGAAKCFGAFLGDECVAFNCYIPFPHPVRKNIRMGHRLVVLPDYQGLGIGLAFDNWLGEYLTAQGYRYHKTISHPALIHAYAKSPRWEMMPGSNKPTKGGAKRLHKTMQNTRKLSTRGFRYVPERSSSSDSSANEIRTISASPTP